MKAKSADYYIWKAELERCPGKYYNGPDKNYGRCSVCGHVSYDHYEGDKCSQKRKEKA